MMDSLSYIMLSCQLLSVHIEDANYKYHKQFNIDHKLDSEVSNKIFSIRGEFISMVNENRPAEYQDPI